MDVRARRRRRLLALAADGFGSSPEALSRAASVTRAMPHARRGGHSGRPTLPFMSRAMVVCQSAPLRAAARGRRCGAAGHVALQGWSC
ncbi:MAG: hypothetical protein ACLTMP_03900 [Eggerthella lenta]